MTLVQTEPKKMYIRVEGSGGWENIVDTSTNTANNNQYFYGIAFTSSSDCSLIGVKFLGTTFTGGGTLRIAQGNYASVAGTEYNVSASDIINGEYTLPSAFSLFANTNYVISFKVNNTGYFGVNNSMTYPIQGNALTFNYGTFSDIDSPYSNMNYIFSALNIV